MKTCIKHINTAAQADLASLPESDGEEEDDEQPICIDSQTDANPDAGHEDGVHEWFERFAKEVPTSESSG